MVDRPSLEVLPILHASIFMVDFRLMFVSIALWFDWNLDSIGLSINCFAVECIMDDDCFYGLF